MLSATCIGHISNVPFTKEWFCTAIIRLIWSKMPGPKEITLIGFHFNIEADSIINDVTILDILLQQII